MIFLVLLLCCSGSFFAYGQVSHLNPFEKKGKFGLQTAAGEVVVEAQFDLQPTLCRGGFWIVTKGGIKEKWKGGHINYMGGQWALLDSTATRYIIDFQPYKISEYIISDLFYISRRPALGLFVIETSDSKYGIIDKTGKEILPPKCDFIPLDRRREKYARYGFILYSINKKYGIVTLNGEEVLPPEMDCIGIFKSDNNEELQYATLRKNGKCGIFLSNGTVIPPMFDEIYSYDFIRKERKSLLVNNKATHCWNDGELLKLILAIDSANAKAVLMTNSGLEIDTTLFARPRKVHQLKSNYMVIEDNGKWGVYSISEKRFIIPFAYDKIEVTSTNGSCVVFTVKNADKYYWIDANNQRLSSAEFEKVFTIDYTIYSVYSTFEFVFPDKVYDSKDKNLIKPGLCNGKCDTVYFIRDCNVLPAKVKVYEGPSGTLKKEIDALEKDINNKLQELKKEKCSCCNGTGKDKNTVNTYKTCFKCSGKGYTTWIQREWSSAYGEQKSVQSGKCDRCGGTGKEIDTEKTLPCPCCKGTGYKSY